jgi:integrase
MKLIFATADFAVEGRSFEGFPLFLDDEGWAMEPAHSFLWETLVLTGGAPNALTWDAYGRRLYDYFAFLEANHLAWNEEVKPQGLSVVARYRDWSLSELKLSAGTINKRLAIVVRFYEWSKLHGLISHLPFNMRTVQTRKGEGFLSHVARSGFHAKPAVMVREQPAPIRIATKSQVKECLRLRLDASHRLLFNLMVRTGLRSCEARTFPEKYVFNPKTRRGLVAGQMIRVDLKPADMHLKFGKPRTIDMPWSLMEDMWSYTLHERERRRQISDVDSPCLLLTTIGTSFSRGCVREAMSSISNKAGFHLTAHMLRHTYATYTLAALRKSAEFHGEPLLYVRDRMGHSDVQTTSKYLHLINQLDAQLALAHEDEMDALFNTPEDAPCLG